MPVLPILWKGPDYHDRSSSYNPRVQINFELVPDDFRQAFHTYYLRSTWVRIALCLAVLSLSVLLLTLVTGNTFAFQSLKPLGFVAIFFLAFIFVSPYFTSKKVLRSPALIGPRTVEVSADGLHFHSALVDSKLAWALFTRWTEASRVFVLYQQSKVVVPVPKRSMTEAQQQEFRALPGAPGSRS